MLEAAREASVPTFVFASTISVYGPNVEQPMVEGVTPAEPLTWYGQSKILGEQLGLYYQRRWGLDFRAARMAAIVGPSRVAVGSATMYTSLILERAALGEPYEIGRRSGGRHAGPLRPRLCAWAGGPGDGPDRRRAGSTTSRRGW